ncbi:unnamed protein product [Amaranthus hypochondriacus]
MASKAVVRENTPAPVFPMPSEEFLVDKGIIPVEDNQGEKTIEHDSEFSMDPLVAGFISSSVPVALGEHFDPIATVEAVIHPSAPHIHKPVSHPLEVSTMKARGRPKKQSSHPAGILSHAQRGFEEAQNTWNAVKMLGFYSNDEEGMISKLRKSKRVAIIEKGAP